MGGGVWAGKEVTGLLPSFDQLKGNRFLYVDCLLHSFLPV